ncbi:hypothetical protein SCLCIDRAFT_126873 [Scleroderma citrinum Foug A]|uniref:ABC transporter domain-containing protein n=1 Tax=Scleroderma citrinum Foug A TaxID=1036808 RepID=A0A0C3DEE5_9AGAM|nr:hypothetical protein SCLCIDRAFT_126873 [Scleroderma citrinum Foug A]
MCYPLSVHSNRWIAVRLEFVGSAIILCAVLLAITAAVNSDVDAGLNGSYALNTTGSLVSRHRYCEAEKNVVSAERIVHCAKELLSEVPHELLDKKPSCEWPTVGQVQFREYSAKYRPELDFVLKDISLTNMSAHNLLEISMKTGICGRTGAGKSSLLLALFHIIESSGTISIDGVDITQIGLHDLRSSISMAPQSPDL